MITYVRNFVRTNPNFTGYIVRYHWYQLEPQKGVYDLSLIERDLERARADGKVLAIKVMDRTFHGRSRPFPVPRYLTQESEFQGGVYQINGLQEAGGNFHNELIILPKHWVMPVIERQSRLMEAIAKAFDDHPALAAVVTEETALQNSWLQPGYSDAAYMAGLIEYNKRMKAAFKQTPVFQLTNYGLESRADELMRQIVEVIGNGFGGPDVLPGINWPYKRFYSKYDGIAPKAASVQWQTYDGQWNMRTVFRDGVDVLKLNYMFWESREQGPYTIHDAIRVVNEERGRINAEPPANIQRRTSPPRPPILLD